MKLQITSDDGLTTYLEIANCDKEPYGLEVVNAQGGVSLSGALRTALSKFFYDNQQIEMSAKPSCEHVCIICNPVLENAAPPKANVVQFKPRVCAPEIVIPPNEIS